MKFPTTQINFPEDSFDLPVYFANNDLPKKGNYYIIARDGYYLHKDAGVMSGIIKVDKIPDIQKVDVSAKLHIPQIPPQIVYKCLVFFRKVWDKQKSEAILFLVFNLSTETYSLFAPEQKSSGLSLSYEPTSFVYPDDSVLLGTIHSHGNFNACHSSTDKNDEADFDGIHLTLGDVHEIDKFSASCCVVINGQRFPISPTTLCGKTYRLKKCVGTANFMICFSKKERLQANVELEEELEIWMSKITPMHQYQPPVRSIVGPLLSSFWSNFGILPKASKTENFNDFID